MAETGFARKKFSLFQAETKFDLVSAFPLMYAPQGVNQDLNKMSEPKGKTTTA